VGSEPIDDAVPRVTVVMITRDRRDEVLSTLGRLLFVPDRPPVIVVDNGSSDGTAAAVANAYPQVRVEALGQNTGAAGRTAGVRLAGTPYVAFSDDDSWWAPGSLARAADVLDAVPRLAVVAGRILVGSSDRVDDVCRVMSTSPLPPVPGAGPGVLGFVACGAVVRRDAYLEVGGFHERYGVGGEESLLAIDLASRGWSCAYVEDVVAHHHPSAVRDHTQRRAREVRNELWTLWLRRPAVRAVLDTATLLPRALGDAGARAGLARAVAGWSWVGRERAPVSAALERRLRLVEAESG